MPWDCVCKCDCNLDLVEQNERSMQKERTRGKQMVDNKKTTTIIVIITIRST